jgi:hypothetical protein
MNLGFFSAANRIAEHSQGSAGSHRKFQQRVSLDRRDRQETGRRSGLSAKILRLANSSYYHVSRTIGTVEDAVLMLGFMTVHAGGQHRMAGSFKKLPGVDLKLFWRYSLDTAVVSKWLAKQPSSIPISPSPWA